MRRRAKCYTIERNDGCNKNLFRVFFKQIEQGVYSVGEQLVSEIQLAEEYGVAAQVPCRNLGGLAELVQEGILVRGRGKGTFVSKPMITDNAHVFTTFALPEDGNRKHFAKVIEVKRAQASVKTARDLGLSSGDEVHEIVILQMNSEEACSLCSKI